MRIISFITLLLIILIGITFATLNSQSVAINYYFGQNTLPLSVLVTLTFILGCLITILISSFIVLKIKLKNYHLQKRIKQMEKELETLRR